MKKYEYKFIDIELYDDESEVEAVLNRLGSEGWELVNFQVDRGAGTYFVFKRII